MLRLKELRLNKGLSQQKVADFLGVSQQAYANYESGKRKPEYDLIVKLSNFFDTTTDYLLGNTDIKKAQELSDETVQRVRKLIKDIENPTDDGDSIGVVMDFGGDTQQFYKLSKEKADIVRKLMDQLKEDTDKK